MVWYFHLFKNFPQFVVIYTVKGFVIVNKAEVDVLLEWSCFFNDPRDVDNLISGSSAFLNPAWTSGSSQFMYCWSLAYRVLSVALLGVRWVQLCDSLSILLALPFFVIGIKTVLFQSCVNCWAFQICWHIECSTFTASSLKIWKSSIGIPSAPLALFVAMLPKAHLT